MDYPDIVCAVYVLTGLEFSDNINIDFTAIVNSIQHITSVKERQDTGPAARSSSPRMNYSLTEGLYSAGIKHQLLLAGAGPLAALRSRYGWRNFSFRLGDQRVPGRRGPLGLDGAGAAARCLAFPARPRNGSDPAVRSRRLTGTIHDTHGVTSWCPTCGTEHPSETVCRRQVEATGPERPQWRVSVISPQGVRGYGVLVAEAG